jgi:uncharacterized protein YdhG (YjbR/CyaY superfamily)
MATNRFASVDDYIAAQPEPAQAVLRRIRDIVKGAVPGADEAISYNIPTFELNGKAVLYFSGWKSHYSIYPFTKELVASIGKDIVPYLSSKGTLKFPLTEPVPAKLIERIARARAKEVAPGAKAASRSRPAARATTKKKPAKKKP